MDDSDAKTSATADENGGESENSELENLRKRLREEKLAHRKKQREFSLKKKRYVEGIQLVEYVSTEELVRLATDLRRKNRVSCEMLNSIRNALFEGEENVEAFLSVDGALQALLRVFTGQDEKYQLLAAKCISNLAKGNEKSSLQVLKAADSYLFAHLAGRNRYVVEACAIAIGNFSSHGPKHVQLILSQGFLPTMKKLLSNADEMLETTFANVLTQLVYHGFDILREEEAKEALLSVIPLFERKSFLVAFLLSVLSARKSLHGTMESHGIHVESLDRLLIGLTENEKESIYYLRIVGNCVSADSANMALDLIDRKRRNFRECLRLSLLYGKDYERKECLGLIGNLVNHPIESVSRFGTEMVKENLELIGEVVKKLAGGNGSAESEMAVDFQG